MNSLIKYLLWLIFPKRCAVCSKLIEKDKHLCKVCEENIERIHKICTVCASEKKLCMCKWRVFHFSGATSVFNYGEYSKQAVNNFKFRGNGEIAYFLSEEMYKSVQKDFENIKFDLVVSVPMNSFKKFLKGFNHSDKLAILIAKKLSVPYRDVLKKVKTAKSQHKLSYKERRENVKGMFASEKISAKNVLLVDDIRTTGATLDECARVLMFAGAYSVYCVTAISNNYRKATVEKL